MPPESELNECVFSLKTCVVELKNYWIFFFIRITVLLFGRFGNISNGNLRRDVKTIELVNATAEGVWKTEEIGCPNLRSTLRYVFSTVFSLWKIFQIISTFSFDGKIKHVTKMGRIRSCKNYIKTKCSIIDSGTRTAWIEKELELKTLNFDWVFRTNLSNPPLHYLLFFLLSTLHAHARKQKNKSICQPWISRSSRCAISRRFSTIGTRFVMVVLKRPISFAE